MPTIRVDQQVFEALQQRAVPLVDTPNSVLRGLLGVNGLRPGKTTRIPRGSSTPRMAYRSPFIRALGDLSGSAQTGDVLARVHDLMKNEFVPEDLEELPSGGTRWHKNANFMRLLLTGEKILDESPRGVWVLSSKGWAEYRDLVRGQPSRFESGRVTSEEESELERMTGKKLNEMWKVNVKHPLYRETGDWYHQLRVFPGALFDAAGYVRFETEREYTSCSRLQIGEEVHVPGGIRTLPNYVKMI